MQSKPRSRLATARPIAPSPMMPTVARCSSQDMSDGPAAIAPAATDASDSTTRRRVASTSASVWSATASMFAPGVVVTTTPASVAASRSIESTPTPTRATTRRRGHARNTDRSNGSVLTIAPTASVISSATSALDPGAQLGGEPHRSGRRPRGRRREQRSSATKAGKVTTTVSPALIPTRSASGTRAFASRSGTACRTGPGTCPARRSRSRRSRSRPAPP